MINVTVSEPVSDHVSEHASEPASENVTIEEEMNYDDYTVIEIDNNNIIVPNHASDPSSWTEEYKKKFILWLHDMDEMPEGWEKLFVRNNPHKTRDRCYKVKAKKEFSDNQWREQDSETKCVSSVLLENTSWSPTSPHNPHVLHSHLSFFEIRRELCFSW